MTGPDFENIFYKNNVAQGATMQSNYMGVGGTNWGWLPDPDVYTSYDYGSAIRETGEIGTPSDPNDIAGSKFGENKLINDFETSVAPVTQTVPGAAPTASNPAVATMARVNPSDGTDFFYVRQADATSTATVSTSLDDVNLDEAAGYTYDDTDTALQYSGTWTHAGVSSGYTSGDYDQTESWSQQAGASMSVTFTGTAVQWIGPKNTNGGIADVYLDGTQVATVDTYSPAGKLYQQVLFSTERPGRGQPHAQDRGQRHPEPGGLGRHRGRRRDQRPDRRAAGRLLRHRSRSRRAPRSRWTAGTRACSPRTTTSPASTWSTPPPR